MALLMVVEVLVFLRDVAVDIVDSGETAGTRIVDVVAQESIGEHFVDFEKIA